MAEADEGQDINDLENALEVVIIPIQASEEKSAIQPQESDDQQPAAFIGQILHYVTVHAISGAFPRLKPPAGFKGIMFDTGAVRSSSGNTTQYLSYCAMMGVPAAIDKEKQALVRFGIGEEISSGMAKLKFPVDDVWLEFSVHVVDADVPILICIDDMDQIGVYFNKLTNTPHHPASGRYAIVKRIQGHPFLCWNPVGQFHFTTSELQRLHRRFGHPAANKLAKVLTRTGIDETPAHTHKVLHDIGKRCTPCQQNAQEPRRFKFRLKHNVEFNHTVYIDIFYIQTVQFFTPSTKPLTTRLLEG